MRLADMQWMAVAPELLHKEAQTSVRTSLQSSGSRHTFEGACAGREVVFKNTIPSRSELIMGSGLWWLL